MRKTAAYLALLGVLVSGGGLAWADEMLPGMNVGPSRTQPRDGPSASTHKHEQSTHHGVREEHNLMTSARRMGMRDMRRSRMAGMALPAGAGRGC